MSKEHLFVRCEMWVEEGEDGQPKSIRYNYRLPDIENAMILELYEMFLESLCTEIAQLEGANQIAGVFNEEQTAEAS